MLFDSNLLFIINLFCCAYMTGLIWLIQLVHYPLLTEVGPEEFHGYISKHAKFITPIVAVPMLLELTTSLALVINRPTWILPAENWACFVLILGIFASTFLIQVPLHNSLQAKRCVNTVLKLVSSNWIRTSFWSLKSALLLNILARNLAL